MKKKSIMAIAAAAFFAATLFGGSAHAAKTTLTFASASAGGALRLASSTWATFIMKRNPDLAINVEASGGGLDNLRLINAGEADLGWVHSTGLWEGKKGLAWAKGRKHTNINTCIPWYIGKTEIWGLGKMKINKLSNLNGKVLSPGPAAGPANSIIRAIVDVFGLKPKRIVNVGWGDALGQQKDGLVDVGIISTISPWARLKDLELTHTVNYFHLSQAQLEEVRKKYPQYAIAITDHRVYKQMKKDGGSLAWVTAIMCSPKLSPEVTYRLVKTSFEGKEELKKTMGAYGRQLSFDSVPLANIIPFHPGAARFYKEKGVKLPEIVN